MKLIEKNLDRIISLIIKGKYYTQRTKEGISNLNYIHKADRIKESSPNNFTSIQEIYMACLEKSYIAQNLSFSKFLQFLIEKETIYIHTIIFPLKTYTRYSREKKIDLLPFVYTFDPKAFFSMTTALYLQGVSRYKEKNIFISIEQPHKQYTLSSGLTQSSIDDAFVNGKNRYPSSIVSYQDYNIIITSPKFTNNVGVIIHNGYRMSSIERALVELVINVQYVKSFDKLLEVFMPIKDLLNVDKVFEILNTYDLIYPYYQAVGFMLNQLGFDNIDLKRFSDKVSEYNFYTQRGKNHYKHNRFWKMYY